MRYQNSCFRVFCSSFYSFKLVAVTSAPGGTDLRSCARLIHSYVKFRSSHVAAVIFFFLSVHMQPLRKVNFRPVLRLFEAYWCDA